MEVEIETVPETQDPVLKPGGLNKTNDIADVAQKEEREKRERVVAKTAETKKRVEEKKNVCNRKPSQRVKASSH
jgi:hypothetical protein